MTAESAKPRLRSASVGASRPQRETALVRDAQRGSASAIEELFRRHWRRAHRAAYLVCGDPVAAEDIAQESFLAAIRALDRFDRRRRFGPWLHRITVNRAIDYARARAARGEQALAGLPEDPPSRRRDCRSPMRWWRRSASFRPSSGRSSCSAHVLDYTPGEIGRMLDLPRGTVNSRLRRGLDRLRPSIEEPSR